MVLHNQGRMLPPLMPPKILKTRKRNVQLKRVKIVLGEVLVVHLPPPAPWTPMVKESIVPQFLLYILQRPKFRDRSLWCTMFNAIIVPKIINSITVEVMELSPSILMQSIPTKLDWTSTKHNFEDIRAPHKSCWKGYLARKVARTQLLDWELRTKSAVVIQSHFRGWIARQMTRREKQHVVLIQSHWKGYLARKDAKDQLQDLRLRMQKSAANVDDSRRLINRLISALSELLSMRSVSNILHTCSTLDVATELSQKCCEELGPSALY